jgi:glutaredoxin 3
MAKVLCTKEQKEYEYYQLGKDFNREEMLEMFPTARTFPQIIVEGEKIGGYDQLREKFE